MAVNNQEQGSRSIWGRAAAVAGAISAVIGLVFLLFPSLRPWTAYDASLSEKPIVTEHYAVFKDYLPRSGESLKRAPYSPETVGNIVSYEAQIEGFNRSLPRLQKRTTYVLWTMYDAETGERVSSELSDQLAWPDAALQADRQKDIASGDAFVPLPLNRDGTFYVTVELWDDQGVRDGLDIRDGVRLDSPGSTNEFEVVSPFLNHLVEQQRGNFALQEVQDYSEVLDRTDAIDALLTTYKASDGVQVTYKLLKFHSINKAYQLMQDEVQAYQAPNEGYYIDQQDTAGNWVVLRGPPGADPQEIIIWVEENVVHIAEAPQDYAIDFYNR